MKQVYSRFLMFLIWIILIYNILSIIAFWKKKKASIHALWVIPWTLNDKEYHNTFSMSLTILHIVYDNTGELKQSCSVPSQVDCFYFSDFNLLVRFLDSGFLFAICMLQLFLLP